MSTRLLVLPQRYETQFVPLAVLGYCLTRTDFFAPLRDVDLNMKTIQHAPEQKLQDIIVSILANCASVKQSDLRIRPDLVLAEAWGREQFAEQSSLADTLDAFSAPTVKQLCQATQVMYRHHAQAPHHDFSQLLLLDTDLTGLPLHDTRNIARKVTSAMHATAMGVNWCGSVRPRITRRCCR